MDTFAFRCVPHGTDESGELGVDYFWLPPDVMDIGVQQRLTVGHNGANLGAGWHLAKVTVQVHTPCVVMWSYSLSDSTIQPSIQ